MTQETLISIVSVLTIITSYSIKLIGFPDQINKIRNTKSTKGISKALYITSYFSFILWVVYGILKKDYTIVFAQGLGVIVGSITLFYLWKYRNR